jgi:hypothetical protein
MAAAGKEDLRAGQHTSRIHTLLASVADIAQGGNGSVNGVPPHVKRRESTISARPLGGRDQDAGNGSCRKGGSPSRSAHLQEALGPCNSPQLLESSNFSAI